MAARITRVSQRSGAPQVTIPIAAPGLATRRSSRTAATGSAANWTELKAVTVSKLSAANGSDSDRPRADRRLGAARGRYERGPQASNPVTVAPRLAARLRANPAPQPASSSAVPGPTPAASSTAS